MSNDNKIWCKLCRAEFDRKRLDSFDPFTDGGTLSQFCSFFTRM